MSLEKFIWTMELPLHSVVNNAPERKGLYKKLLDRKVHLAKYKFIFSKPALNV